MTIRFTGHRPMWVDSAQRQAIEDAARTIGAPVGSVFVTAETSNKERKSGFVGRVFILLDDEAPGWRAKDQNEHRRQLKAVIQTIVPDLKVYVQAGYSCLSQNGGMVERRDDSGNVIGVY